MKKSRLFFRLKMLDKIASSISKIAVQDTYAPASIEEAKAILNIYSNLDMKLLKEKYREAVVANHPDLGGSNEKLLKINAAFKYLKDKLEEYDRYFTNPTSYAPPAPPDPKTLYFNVINGYIEFEDFSSLTQVVVSTVYMGRNSWETMVFKSKDSNIEDYTALDEANYENERDARDGHIHLYYKWYDEMNSIDPIPEFEKVK